MKNQVHRLLGCSAKEEGRSRRKKKLGGKGGTWKMTGTRYKLRILFSSSFCLWGNAPGSRLYVLCTAANKENIWGQGQETHQFDVALLVLALVFLEVTTQGEDVKDGGTLSVHLTDARIEKFSTSFFGRARGGIRLALVPTRYPCTANSSCGVRSYGLTGIWMGWEWNGAWLARHTGAEFEGHTVPHPFGIIIAWHTYMPSSYSSD